MHSAHSNPYLNSFVKDSLTMIQKNVSLKPYNTFGIDVSASHFAKFGSVDELSQILNLSEIKNLPLLILGGGSNLLLTQNFAGLVLKNELHGISISKTENEITYVKSAAGEIWHNLVLFCIENNLGGIENLSLIPGSVGAAPMQNIGAYGIEIKDVFHELEAYEIATGKIRAFNLSDCKFGYRESVFKRDLKNTSLRASLLNLPKIQNSTPLTAPLMMNCKNKEFQIRR
jgi:UDP-N-acetylmuramate dehydrogenase